MMVTAEGIVLRSLKYSESSVILTFFTKELGKVAAIAKGARRPKNRFGSSLQPMQYVTAVLYHREGRDLQVLAQCDVREAMPGLAECLDRMSTGMAAVELVDAVMREGETNPQLFGLLLETLRTASGATNSPLNALYFFEIRLLDILGFRPGLSRCAVCGNSLSGMEHMSREEGMGVGNAGAVCGKCACSVHGLLSLSPPALGILQRLQRLTLPEAATRIRMSETVRGEIGTVLWHLFQWNVDGIGRLRSREVFATLERGIVTSRGL